ncbi:MAG: helix-turn-helix domain-containing protein, partial [Candidatus Kuenenia stuttgartiensis]|nr:helix-turn-helix domain-containing protein [Candidatus Kuenenia stuttgartiensis]
NTQNLQLLSEILHKVSKIEKIAKKLDTQSNLNKDFLTIKEACAYLGISRGTLNNYVIGGKLTKLSLGGRVAFAASELRALFDNPEIQPAA